MSIFGKQQSTVPPQTDTPAFTDDPDDAFDSLPKLPKPRGGALITKGMLITGSVQGEGDIQVDGAIEGEIKLQGTVIVTQTGRIKGPVEADVIRVAGRVEGNICARNHLRLEHTGRIDGDITTSSFIIDDGGLLNGRTMMVENKEKAAEDKAEEPAKAATPIPEDLEFGSGYQVV